LPDDVSVAQPISPRLANAAIAVAMEEESSFSRRQDFLASAALLPRPFIERRWETLRDPAQLDLAAPKKSQADPADAVTTSLDQDAWQELEALDEALAGSFA
jgi:hypothetical protein